MTLLDYGIYWTCIRMLIIQIVADEVEYNLQRDRTELPDMIPNNFDYLECPGSDAHLYLRLFLSLVRSPW